MVSITQIVIYKTYKGNPGAALGIVELARRLLGEIPGTELRVGLAVESDRSVVISNGMVMKMTTWPSEEYRQRYLADHRLKEYVRLVLRGWKLKGDPDGAESAQRFVDQIMLGGEDLETERDLSVPDAEVLWGGERIVIFSSDGV